MVPADDLQLLGNGIHLALGLEGRPLPPPTGARIIYLTAADHLLLDLWHPSFHGLACQ